MTELDFVIEGFEHRFRKYKGKKIILHGTREYARQILSKFGSEYNFAAVMTNEELTEDSFCGRQIIQPYDIALLSADLVILTERVKYECSAYDSIKRTCSELGIKVLDMYGVDIKQAYRDYKNRHRSLEEDEKIVRDHDIIVFETIDTFLTPKGEKLVPVQSNKSIYRYARENRKAVYFSLRKSFPEKRQIEALINAGVISDEKDPFLIRRTGEDLSLRMLSEKNKEKKIAYFGAGFANEFLLPRYYGMDSYYAAYAVSFADALNEIVSHPYNSSESKCKTYSSIRELIRSCDVISFDIFDTLITRKVLEPWDVLDVMSERLKEVGIDNYIQIADERKNVQLEFPYADIHQLYRIIQNRMGLSDDQRDILMETELSIEKEMIIRRESVCSLFDFAKESGKKVILTSDMYIPGDLLGDILNGINISGWDEIFVSCDHHSFKSQELFGILRGKYSHAKILHLGNDLDADILPTGRYSIQSVLIPSGLDLAKQSSWGKILDIIENPDEKNLLGLIISRIFNDPFAPVDYFRLEHEKQMERFAIGACMPVILGYLFWLEKKLGTENFDKLLLPSRDGFILLDLYEELRQRSRVLLPEGVYFYSDRHSAFLMCADDRSYWKSVMEIFNPERSAVDIFYNLFGFDPEDKTNDLIHMFEKNQEKINSLITQQKLNFRKYIENSAISPTGHYAVMDFVSSGKTLDFITKGTGMDLCGYFFSLRKSPFETTINIHSYLESEKSGFFVDYFMEMEHIMTSPEAALDRFDEYGNPMFAEEVRSQSDISDILYIQDIIKKTASDYLRHFYHDGITINPLFADESYAADGLHGIMKEAFDDWAKEKLI